MTDTPLAETTSAPTFADLGLSDTLLAALERAGYDTPTPIQAATVPLGLDGRDVLGSAQTGTGKTAAFVLPMLQRLAAAGPMRGPRPPRALVLAPTRELAEQVDYAIRTYGRGTGLFSVLLVGGMPHAPQNAMLRRGVDIVVATPGRLMDHVRFGTVSLDAIEVLVLDEADRMLDMGFQPDIQAVHEATPSERQTLLFSATMPKPVERLARELLRDPAHVAIGERRNPAATVDQRVVRVDEPNKLPLLLHLLRGNAGHRTLVFVRTKQRADEIADALYDAGFPAALLHGDRTQAERRRALNALRYGDVDVLVATDVAARGLDISDLTVVVNYDAPMQPEDYIHRIGRTGRADAEGTAVSFVSKGEDGLLRQIERHIGKTLSREVIEPFSRPDEKPRTHTHGSFKGHADRATRPHGGKGRPYKPYRKTR